MKWCVKKYNIVMIKMCTVYKHEKQSVIYGYWHNYTDIKNLQENYVS